MKIILSGLKGLLWLGRTTIILLFKSCRAFGRLVALPVMGACLFALVFFVVLTGGTAHAGWFSWIWGNDKANQHLESANRALETAAQVVNESSRQQADQNIRVLEAIGTLSNERTELAAHLDHLAVMAARDSEWAAALTMAGPVLLAVSALIVAGLALWLAYSDEGTQGQANQTDTLMLFIDELGSGNGSGRLEHLGRPKPDRDVAKLQADTNQSHEQEV